MAVIKSCFKNCLARRRRRNNVEHATGVEFMLNVRVSGNRESGAVGYTVVYLLQALLIVIAL